MKTVTVSLGDRSYPIHIEAACCPAPPNILRPCRAGGAWRS